jgi:hypothetical protein
MTVKSPGGSFGFDEICHPKMRAQARSSVFIRFQLSARTGSNAAPKSPPSPSVHRPRLLDSLTRYALCAAERPPHPTNITMLVTTTSATEPRLRLPIAPILSAPASVLTPLPRTASDLTRVSAKHSRRES